MAKHVKGGKAEEKAQSLQIQPSTPALPSPGGANKHLWVRRFGNGKSTFFLGLKLAGSILISFPCNMFSRVCVLMNKRFASRLGLV